jgi:8-oxo-dGTP diphosphatase
MPREAVLAAGGIVLRREQPPQVAVVRLRKRDEWVLPKGKLDEGETARAAAKREVLEETGHNVTVHEFLGTLVYESGARSKVVHYWRMEANGGQVRELMHDIRAVDWLPLDAALARLSRSYERAFLENVGPLALATFSRKLKAAAAVNKTTTAAKETASKAPPAKKRRSQPVIAPPEQLPPSEQLPLPEELPLAEAAPAPSPLPEPVPQPAAPVEAEIAAGEITVTENEPVVAETPRLPVEPDMAIPVEDEVIPAEHSEPVPPPEAMQVSPETAQAATPEGADRGTATPDENRRRSLAQKVRNWLGRAA